MKTIGIDLGTTNSCVYYLDDEGNPVLINDRFQRKIFPSVVWRPDPEKDIIVGHKAKSRMGQMPAPVVAVKRKIGTTETVELGGEAVSPVEVSAHILSYLGSLVKETTGDDVGAAVVTVPAYFDAAPKKDTFQAAVDALFGGDVERARNRLELQLEPEAAAFAYTLEDPAERLRILAYDLGGGTFDVTLLEKSPEAGLAALKFGGDPHLGGDNVDDRVATWLLYLLRGGKAQALDRILDPDRYPPEKRYTVLQQVLTHDTAALRGELLPEDRDLLIDANPLYALDLDARNPEDLCRIQKLKALAEKAKMDLTVSSETNVIHQGAFEDQEGEIVEIDIPLTRGTFNRLVGDLVERTLDETQRVLSASGLNPGEVDRIILVGGSTRMPVVREELERVFDCAVVEADPDLIVARGAALRARELGVAAPAGDAGLSLEYPQRTAEQRTRIKGSLAQPLPEGHVYLTLDGEDLTDAPVDGDRFLLERVPLRSETRNVFRVEVFDAKEDMVAEAEIVIVHDPQALVTGPLTPKITKPISAQGMRGLETLLAEGIHLPAEKDTECFRGTREDQIVIPFYEGERWLADVVISGVDSSLPEGAVIKLKVALDKDYNGSASATVQSTGQNAVAEFEISRLAIPSLEEMDQDLEGVLDEFDNDINTVRNREQRAGFSRRARRLEADFRKARRAVTPDLHHLYTLIGEMRKLIIDVRGAQDFLEPPLEVFERLVGLTRNLAQGLGPDSPIPKDDAVDKIAALERAGRDAWEREDATNWRSVNAEVEKLKNDLESARQGPGPSPSDVPPELIQREALNWLRGLREKARDHGVEERFDGELEQLERSVRHVDLRSGGARDSLLQIIQEQLQPLDHRLARAIKEQGGAIAADGAGTGVNVYF